MNYVYIIHAEGTNFYKIGVTKDLEKRLSAINNTSPYRCYILYKIEFKERKKAFELESKVHNKFDNKRLNGEWFELSSNELERVKIYINKPIDKLDEVFICSNEYFETKDMCISCGEYLLLILKESLGLDIRNLRISIKQKGNKYAPFVYISISKGAAIRYTELAFFILLKYNNYCTTDLSKYSFNSIKIEVIDNEHNANFTFCINKNSFSEKENNEKDLPSSKCNYCNNIYIKKTFNQKYCSKKCRAKKQIDQIKKENDIS